MLENLNKYKIVLASNSPRRKELLGGLELEFQVHVISGIDETYPESLQAIEIPLYIARVKADAYKATMAEDELLITADTIVWTAEGVLGKPQDREDACRMLRLLSGKTHKVITGVCLWASTKNISFSVETEVTFTTLSEEEINYYVEKYSPYDKAGSYGIQEWIGYIGVEAIHGSFYNVMGLPVQRLYQELKRF